MDWIVDVLDQYVSEVRPAFVPGKRPAFWITERRDRMSLRRLNEACETARRAADLPTDLDLHSLRHIVSA
jgi:site-specific recombinase XerD